MRRLARVDPSLLLIGLTAFAVAGLGWRQRWATDDAYINFRVVDNLLEGSGPVFNGGERVEAYTSPLWLGLLAAVHWILGADQAWISVMLGLGLSVAGVAIGCLGALLLWRGDGSRRLRRRRAPPRRGRGAAHARALRRQHRPRVHPARLPHRLRSAGRRPGGMRRLSR